MLSTLACLQRNRAMETSVTVPTNSWNGSLTITKSSFQNTSLTLNMSPVYVNAYVCMRQKMPHYIVNISLKTRLYSIRIRMQMFNVQSKTDRKSV